MNKVPAACRAIKILSGEGACGTSRWLHGEYVPAAETFARAPRSRASLELQVGEGPNGGAAQLDMG